MDRKTRQKWSKRLMPIAYTLFLLGGLAIYHLRHPEFDNHEITIIESNEDPGSSKNNYYKRETTQGYQNKVRKKNNKKKYSKKSRVAVEKKEHQLKNRTQTPIDECTFQKLLELGITSRVAKNWMNYTKAGGKIKSIKQASKIYGMDSLQLKIVKEFIIFPESIKKTKKKTVPLRLDVNIATRDEWKKIRGIGQVLSDRIVKFRDRLGGFSHLEQIKETYGIEDSLYTAIEHHLYLMHDVNKIDINRLDANQLAYHPYISNKQAKVITKFRSAHGPFEDKGQLLQTQIVDSQWLKKIDPYLDIPSN